MRGIVVIDKPPAWTSHDVVAVLRKRLNTRRIGHAGTLDPIATGVLVVAVGHATRFLQYLPTEPKVYEVTLKFGTTTKTYDREAEPEDEKEIPANLEEEICRYLPEFVGDIQQLPPLYSAVKKEGVPLYKYARQGEEVEREPRSVTIHEIILSQVTADTADLKITCGGGTYVRSLAHDLGQMIGCGAYVQDLRRTGVGIFGLEGAVHPQEATGDDLRSLRNSFLSEEIIEVSDADAQILRNGQSIRLPNGSPDGDVLIVSEQLGEIAMAFSQSGHAKPVCVIPSS